MKKKYYLILVLILLATTLGSIGLKASLRRKIERNTASPRFILTQVGIGYRFVGE